MEQTADPHLVLPGEIAETIPDVRRHHHRMPRLPQRLHAPRQRLRGHGPRKGDDPDRLPSLQRKKRHHHASSIPPPAGCSAFSVAAT